jgi:hypothetical protein
MKGGMMANRRLWLLLALGAAVGCEPERRILWAPDGSKALVISKKGLYLCDAEGRLSKKIADNATPVAAWYPDSKRFLIERTQVVKTWRELTLYLTDAEQKQSTTCAKIILDEIARKPDTRPDDLFDTPFESRFTPDATVDPEVIWLYLLEFHADTMRRFLSRRESPTTFEQERASAKKELYLIERYACDGSGAVCQERMLRTPSPIFHIAVAPTGRTVAYVAARIRFLDLKEADLLVVPGEGAAPPKRVATRVSLSADWTPDGRSLVYGRASVPKPNGKDKDMLRLGAIARRQVCGEDGSPLRAKPRTEPSADPSAPESNKDEDGFPPAEDLAGLIFFEKMQVLCLRDGRILFTAGEVTLPATTNDLPERLSLFTIAPGQSPTVQRLLPRAVETRWQGRIDPTELALSPNQKRLAACGEHGNVAVLALDTGKETTVLEGAWKKNDRRIMPAWRSDNELCVVVPAGSKLGSPKRPEAVLWTEKETKILSRDWPQEVVEGLLSD